MNNIKSTINCFARRLRFKYIENFGSHFFSSYKKPVNYTFDWREGNICYINFNKRKPQTHNFNTNFTLIFTHSYRQSSSTFKNDYNDRYKYINGSELNSFISYEMYEDTGLTKISEHKITSLFFSSIKMISIDQPRFRLLSFS